VKVLKYILTGCFLLSAWAVYAQNYGDEWIDYNKRYFKISIAQDGIYRISYADLINAGFPVASVNPKRIQLFHRGVEQAIFVQGEGDFVFNTTDYIEFYGQKNDGTLDAGLYEPSTAQPHNYYNLYSDSTAYFITYDLFDVNGKRILSRSENNVGGLPAQTSHNEEILLLHIDNYSPGQSYNSGDVTKYSFFDEGEGWTSPQFQETEYLDSSIAGVEERVTGDGNPALEVLLVGRDNVTHQALIEVGPSAGALRSLGTVSFVDYEHQSFNANINWSDISGAGDLLVRVTALGDNGGNDRISVSYVKLTYKQSFNLTTANNKYLYLNTNAGDKSYIEINNIPPAPRLYDVTNPDNVRRIGFNQSGSSLNAVINLTSSPRKLLVSSDVNLLTPILKPVNFRNIDPTASNYIIISNQYLRNGTSGIGDPVRKYAQYRASNKGGNYDTLTVNMSLLYNQYNYGEVSPLAIKNFMRKLVDQGNPEFLFLIGKGLDPRYNFHRNSAGFVEKTVVGEVKQIRDLVPSVGNPGCDMLFTAGLAGTTYEPAVPVGRLPALEPKEVLDYLNKVKETDDLPYDDLWRKNLLHLSGGLSLFELTQFKSYIDGFAARATGDYLGGSVTSKSKQSNSTVELINVTDEVNKGLNMITFFGHSSPSVIDIDIGYVSDPILGFDNKGKYPMFLINGCNAGQFFNQDVLFGEDWILAADKGALGFIANSSFGFSTALRDYTNTFYDVAYADKNFINQPIGVIHKETARRYMQSQPATPLHITQSRQMVLLGDPAVKLFGAEQPDFEINSDNVYAESFNSDPISAESDSFAINLVVRNFGITTNDSLRVNIMRTLADNTSISYDSIYPPVDYSDTLLFVVDNSINNSFGNNQFAITIDAGDSIPELNETNNSTIFNLFVPLFGTKNLYPFNFAIENNHEVELLAQATDLFSEKRDFLFEMDTVYTFNSPFQQQATVNAKGVARWKPALLPDIPVNDSTVYFWRTKFAQPKSGESDEWSTSSFIYINNGPEGWSQSVFRQYDDNDLTGLTPNIFQKSLEFEETSVDVFIKTFGAANPATIADVSVQFDNNEYIIDNGRRCRDNTVNIVAFHKSSASPYAPLPLPFPDPRTCGRTPQVINSYRFGEFETGTDDLLDCIDAIVPGDSVVLFTIGDPLFSAWSGSVKSKLEEIGASTADINGFLDGEPIILVGKKGVSAGDATLFTATATPKDEQQLTLTKTIYGIYSDGQMESVLVGPASNWQSVINQVAVSELPQTDVFGIDVLGVGFDGSETELLTNQTDKIIDISFIDTQSYPYIKLRYNTSDPTNLTASQLKKWQVVYTGVPEGIVVVPDGFKMSEKLQEGQQLDIPLGFYNISNKNFSDSLAVDYSFFNNTSRSSFTSSININSPAPKDTTTFSVAFNSVGKSGVNDFNVFVNPRKQLEQYYENNILDIKEYVDVDKDNINPILDVAFDGEHILDGDIVSPSPLISMVVKENNQYLLKQDTTGFNMFIKKTEPCDNGEPCTYRRIPFSSSNVKWFPATEDSDFKVEYKPDPLEDGVYTLRVEATDESGNKSGMEPYQINFEVINESTITNFYPYPNPFSTSTRFIFTLTGSVIPDQIKIQIMTVSGRVVREITQNELGPIRIGNNITDYAWNGKDEFGDQLANGVYIYRVIVKANGEDISGSKFDKSANKAFKKGYGKLYLLR